MAGRTQHDGFMKRPKRNSSPIKWSSAEKPPEYPDKVFEVYENSIDSHYIAREKELDGTWKIRPSIKGQEKFVGTEFLVAENPDRVCWQKVENKFPDDALPIKDGPRNQLNSFIGRCKSKGAGQVKLQNDSKYVFISESGEEHGSDYEVLCKKK